MTEQEIQDLIATEMSHVIVAEIPMMYTGSKNELASMLDKRIVAILASEGGPTRTFTYHYFLLVLLQSSRESQI